MGIFVAHGQATPFHDIARPALQTRLRDVELGRYQPLVRRIQSRILVAHVHASLAGGRSEERRVGKEGRSRWARVECRKKATGREGTSTIPLPRRQAR